MRVSDFFVLLKDCPGGDGHALYVMARHLYRVDADKIESDVILRAVTRWRGSLRPPAEGVCR